MMILSLPAVRNIWNLFFICLFDIILLVQSKLCAVGINCVCCHCMLGNCTMFMGSEKNKQFMCDIPLFIYTKTLQNHRVLVCTTQMKIKYAANLQSDGAIQPSHDLCKNWQAKKKKKEKQNRQHSHFRDFTDIFIPCQRSLGQDTGRIQEESKVEGTKHKAMNMSLTIITLAE